MDLCSQEVVDSVSYTTDVFLCNFAVNKVAYRKHHLTTCKMMFPVSYLACLQHKLLCMYCLYMYTENNKIITESQCMVTSYNITTLLRLELGGFNISIDYIIYDISHLV